MTHRASIALGSGIALAAALLSSAAPRQPATAAPGCALVGAVARVPELPEGSGVAASHRTPGRFWAHNDSGAPVLVAIDATGTAQGRLWLQGAAVVDWEAVAVGRCGAGSCIYVGDIGDNEARRPRITLYRVAEPAAGATSAPVEVFHATYPDGAHDAEAMLVTPEGQLYVVTKGEFGPVALYRFPDPLRSGAILTLTRVGTPREAGRPSRRDRITDAAVSPDGRWSVLRSSQALTFYRTADLIAGRWRVVARMAIGSIGEPQGEGVTFGRDGSVYVLGEGGGGKRPGSFARLECPAIR